jgi:large subunit ribosomal protein L22
MRYRYSVNTKSKDIVKALGRSLPISTKQSIEVCNWIRNKEVGKAKKMLDKVMQMKQAVPYRRFHGDTGHKTGIGPGRYPVKTCGEIKEMLDKIEASASQKGLNTESLVITHISAQKAARQWHYGRKKRRMQKRTHIEIVAKESEPKKEGKKPEKKAA